MALELTGIENIGEFYSGHYLSAVLERDLKATFAKWKEAKDERGQRLPQNALAQLADRYFAARSQAEEASDPAERLAIAQEFHARLLEALGYQRQPVVEPLDGDEVVPLHASLRRDGNRFLWIVDAPFTEQEDDDPLANPPLEVQLPADADGARLPRSAEQREEFASWRELLDARLFKITQPPRWVLFLAGREALLIERHKWPQGKYLRFDFDELFGRKQAMALRGMAGLLHKDVLAPDAGLCLHDSLDENSHKHAYAVSSDLKHGVRRAVELLANEAVYYRREVQKQGVFNDDEFAGKLTAECLTRLYRLLFLFYVEARGKDLGAVPMDSEAYRRGYSLESLRELELVPLNTEHARNGFFIYDSLKTLFKILNKGFPALDAGDIQTQNRLLTDFDMWVDALNSPLFDDDRLDVLKNVRFRNDVLQEVLQLLSLSAQKKKKSRGRISYAQLGINQLGAVYEGLLSYTGFFATEDLYEVAAEKDCKKLSGKPAAEREALKTYFVPASRIGDYKEGEIVKDENERKVVHKKGTFIFRLAGRNRKKSASYYTPEVLTKCLVKYALKELLWEEGEEGEKPKRKKTADEILTLTICEPAMGSSAFLIEAVDQLADAYLEARQEELGETISPEGYQREKRRVKARLATNNCYGVDLNPTAVELAKVSLWLATMHEGGKCPWFGLRLATGNSLVGARREVFKTADVTRPNRKSKGDPNWLGLVPQPVPLHHGEDGPPVDEHWTPPPRPKGTIYHFLLPAEGMAAFDKDKVIKQLAPESVKRIKEWRKEFCKPFTKKDAERLEQISDAVDRLFAQVVRERVLATQETSDRIPVWGEPPSAQQADLLVRDQEEVAASLEDGSSAYRRLKLAMDAWCALWFWPIEDAELLPDRAIWLAQMELILQGQVTHEELWQQQNLFANISPASQGELATSQHISPHVESQHEASVERVNRLQALSDAFRERRANYFEDCGLADIDSILDESASLGSAQDIAERLHFHHWLLRFPEIFAVGTGFDLILGNPPWVRLEFHGDGVLADYDPSILIRDHSVSELDRMREASLANPASRATYFDEYTQMQGIQSFFGSAANYPKLGRATPNLYKCFILASFRMAHPNTIVSLLHEEGAYDDTTGITLRKEMYDRLLAHYQFENAFKFFPDVGHKKKFSINVYRGWATDIGFWHVSALMHPVTLDESWAHDGIGPVPTAKDNDGNWDLRGHRRRILNVDGGVLQLLSEVYNPGDTTGSDASLPVFHDERLLEILRKFSAQTRKLGHLSHEFTRSQMLPEKVARRDGTLRKETTFPDSTMDWVLSGPHVDVGNPMGQTPNEGCKSKGDYSRVDLLTVDSNYLPRSNFVPACDAGTYRGRLPKHKGRSVLEYFRYVHREMVNPVAERTLIASILPPGAAHIDTLYSIAFDDDSLVVLMAGLAASLPYDFFVRTTGTGHIKDKLIYQVPLLEESQVQSALLLRSLSLNCVTNHYAALWASRAPMFRDERWTSVDTRLSDWKARSGDWVWATPLRSDFERRLALVEIDVLVAIGLGLSLDELGAIYRSQFPVLQEYERERAYDGHGRIVPTARTAAGRAGVNLQELAEVLREQAGFDVHAEYHADGANTQELGKQKIRLGKKEADVLGVSERCTMADLLAETEVRWSDEDHPEGRPVPLVGLRYTDPGLEPRMARVYPTPWTRCDREADYRQAWAEFERRLGKKMPESTRS